MPTPNSRPTSRRWGKSSRFTTPPFILGAESLDRLSDNSLTTRWSSTGFNGHDFVIRKDGKHVMFTDINNNQCKSIYYALDLSSRLLIQNHNQQSSIA